MNGTPVDIEETRFISKGCLLKVLELELFLELSQIQLLSLSHSIAVILTNSFLTSEAETLKVSNGETRFSLGR